ncbi:MAG: hypothetical protein NVSMB65_05070 [Chloroflexota bacterium]
MTRTLPPVGTTRWIWVTLAAQVFSLLHTLTDFGLVLTFASSRFIVQRALLAVLIVLLYLWWGWICTRAMRGSASGFVGLMAFALLWVVIGNGLTIIFCWPPCGSIPFYADTLHLGNLILGPLAALVAYRAMRRGTASERWQASIVNLVTMVAFLVAIYGVEATIFAV